MSDTTIDLEHFRAKLNELRTELEAVQAAGAEAAETVELDQARVGRLSRMDALQAQSMSIEAQRRRELKLKAIDGALARMERGEFGLCFECGDAIDPRRLEFDPTTTRCIHCAR